MPHVNGSNAWCLLTDSSRLWKCPIYGVICGMLFVLQHGVTVGMISEVYICQHITYVISFARKSFATLGINYFNNFIGVDKSQIQRKILIPRMIIGRPLCVDIYTRGMFLSNIVVIMRTLLYIANMTVSVTAK